MPPRGVSVPLEFVREGIRYDDLSEDERDTWDELDWGEYDEGGEVDPPEEVTAAELNKFLFNDGHGRQGARVLDDRGRSASQAVIGSARRSSSPRPAARRLTSPSGSIANYPALVPGRVRPRYITHECGIRPEPDRRLLRSRTSRPTSPSRWSMLDTGIDVHEVVNLVFFKLVRSKTKFWQMLGRGTRLCPNLFGPGDDKTELKVFDFCQNLGFFSHALAPAEGSGRTNRCRSASSGPASSWCKRSTPADSAGGRARGLRRRRPASKRSASMNDDNFLVRPTYGSSRS
ncbi:MAG: hypothetical protein U5L08_14790 [Xanthomonadales bacterium]|nr:hypothetical protein [Xanthomonadales bacterium]